MKRSKIKEIEYWYNSDNRKPLMVWGARQVGKTYLLKDLKQENFLTQLAMRKNILIILKQDIIKKYPMNVR